MNSRDEDSADELRRYTLTEVLTGRAHPIVYWTFALAGAAALGTLLG